MNVLMLLFLLPLVLTLVFNVNSFQLHEFDFKSIHFFFPADTDTLFTSQDGSDNVFNRTDESVNLPNDNEERDVLTDMPRDSSAVNRFDRFLKERKDSELLNLMALRREMDDGSVEGAEYIKVSHQQIWFI